MCNRQSEIIYKFIYYLWCSIAIRIYTWSMSCHDMVHWFSTSFIDVLVDNVFTLFVRLQFISVLDSYFCRGKKVKRLASDIDGHASFVI